jgi:hypothetical protein
VLVFVPDRRADAPDGGRSHVLDSAEFVARNATRFGGDPERTVLAGWPLGAKSECAPELGRCRPATDERVLSPGQRTARVLARAAGIMVHSPDRLPE